VLPEIAAAVSFLQLDLSLALSCFLNKNSSAPLLFSQQDCCFSSFLFLCCFCSWHLTKKPLGLSPRFLQLLVLGISPRTSWLLTKSQLFSWHLLLLASHQESLVLSTRMLQLSCSWHLTKNLLASHQESLALSTRLLPLPQEWVRPLALINLMREGEEFSNLTVEIRLDGWLRFGVSSLTLTLIIKLSFNLHLTN
jgi:hypothetical protein